MNGYTDIFKHKLPVACVQGLGFVGAAMALVIACARDGFGNPLYNVIGVDLPQAKDKIDQLNNGVFPIETADGKMREAAERAAGSGNFYATDDPGVFSCADIVLMNINLDLYGGKLRLGPFKEAAETIAGRVRENTLIIVESTVPPGTCRRILAPIFERAYENRGFSKNSVLIAHAYERVTPGEHYWDSIVNFHRVYSGMNEEAAIRCGHFLSDIINTKDYPLTRLAAPEASEMAKVMENSYRAVNIAFIEEWSRMAERIGVDLYSVVDAIKKRPTHSNMMRPGFGVGGYCITKDPLFAKQAAKEIYGYEGMDFPFCTLAVETNNRMPLASLDAIEKHLGGLRNKKILVLGVSYRQDVADTRYSPTEIFVREAEQRGAAIQCHDPLVSYWAEMDLYLPGEIPSPAGYDCAVFAVPHRQYSQLDMKKWLFGEILYIFDANRVLTPGQVDDLHGMGVPFGSIGRGA